MSTLGLTDIGDREEERKRYSQLANEFPIASAIGEAAPALALPGGIAAQTAYSAALPYLQDAESNPWMQSAAGAGITVGLGVGGRIAGRIYNAGRGKLGKTLESGVVSPDFGEGVGGRMAERWSGKAA